MDLRAKQRASSVSTKTNDKVNTSIAKVSEPKVKNTRKVIRVCRICLEEDGPSATGEHSFVHVCKCTGTVGGIHQDCLMEWVNTVIQKRV